MKTIVTKYRSKAKFRAILKTSKGFFKYRKIRDQKGFLKLVEYLSKKQISVYWANFYDAKTKKPIGSWGKNKGFDFE